VAMPEAPIDGRDDLEIRRRPPATTAAEMPR
jgi:hypothetical protein